MDNGKFKHAMLYCHALKDFCKFLGFLRIILLIACLIILKLNQYTIIRDNYFTVEICVTCNGLINKNYHIIIGIIEVLEIQISKLRYILID